MRSTNVRILPLIAVIGLALLTGCGTFRGTAAPMQPRHGQPERADFHRHGAPRIAHPLPATEFAADPCTILGAAELRILRDKIQIPVTGKRTTDAGFPGCDYTPDPNKDIGSSSAHITVIRDGHGLADLYAVRKEGDVFRPLPPVEGYPAVNYGLIDERRTGSCTISIGINDSARIDVDMDLTSYGNDKQHYATSCVPTMTLAQAVVRAIKERAR